MIHCFCNTNNYFVFPLLDANKASTLIISTNRHNGLLYSYTSEVLGSRMQHGDARNRFDSGPAVADNLSSTLDLSATRFKGRLGQLRELEGIADPNLPRDLFL